MTKEFVPEMSALLNEALELSGRIQQLGESLPRFPAPDGALRLDACCVQALHAAVSVGGMISNTYFAIMESVTKTRDISSEVKQDISDCVKLSGAPLYMLDCAVRDLQHILTAQERVFVPFDEEGKTTKGAN